jgi:hypothetical protein
MNATTARPQAPVARAPRSVALVLTLAAVSALGLGACGSSRTGNPASAPATTAAVTATSAPATTTAGAPPTTAGPSAAAKAAQAARLAALDSATNQIDHSLHELNGQLSQSTNTSEPDPAN